MSDNAMRPFVSESKSTATAFIFIQQHLVEYSRILRKYHLHSLTVTDDTQRSFAIGKECDLIRIVFGDGFINYGYCTSILNSSSGDQLMVKSTLSILSQRERNVSSISILFMK